jgi:hypothetical protein
MALGLRQTGAVLRLALYAAPLVIVPALFIAVVRTGDPPAPLVRRVLPDEPYELRRCTWYCHNHGCNHRPVLPQALAGDRGLFGATVRLLHTAGRRISDQPGVGYGAANLLLFCALWPGALYGLYLVCVRQRLEIRALRRARRGEP